MPTSANTATAVSLRINDEKVEVPRHAGWYEPTDNVKRSLRHEFEFAVTPEDVTNVIEKGEIAHVERRPSPNRLSNGQPEITYRGETAKGDRIEVDVSPAGTVVGPLGGFGSAVRDGVCQMQILRIREAFETFVEPISQCVEEEENNDGAAGSDD